MADETNGTGREPAESHGQLLKEVFRLERGTVTRIYAVRVHDDGILEFFVNERAADGAARPVTRQVFAESDRATEWLTAQQMLLQKDGWVELRPPASVAPLGVDAS